MMLAITLLLLSAAITSSDTHWGIPEEDHVGVLTNSTFADFVAKHPHVFVKFYAPWCGHCKSMVPAYSALAQRLKEAKVPVVKVDATVEGDLATEFGVEGFPTLKLFVNGEPVDYQGERTEDAMYSFVSKKTGPASEQLSTEDQIKELEDQKISVLFFLPEDDEETLKAFNAVAGKSDNVIFKYSFDNKLKEKYHDSKYLLIVFRNFDDGKKLMANDEKPTQEQINDFVNAVKYPVLSDFDEAGAERIFGGESPAFFFFTDNDDIPELAEFKEFAKDNAQRIIFSKSKISEELGARLSEFLGVTASEGPTARIIRFKDNNVDKFKVTDLTKAGFAKALDDFEAGRLGAYYKSQPTPETNDEPVKVIVGENFDSIVINNDKFVLLEAYAPWCGHCKQLEPVYNKLGELLKDANDVVIAKIDATANEHKAVNIEGFPTIFLFKPGQKDAPLTYEGDRSLSGLVKYIEEQVGRKLVHEELPEDIEMPETDEL